MNNSVSFAQSFGQNKTNSSGFVRRNAVHQRPVRTQRTQSTSAETSHSGLDIDPALYSQITGKNSQQEDAGFGGAGFSENRVSAASTGLPAGFWIRFLAAMIDGIFMMLCGYVVLSLLGGPTTELNILEMTKNIYLFSFMGLIYFVVLPATPLQGTLGKFALGIKITDLQGQPISLGRSIGRYFSTALSALIVYIGYLMVAFSSEKQALHDKIAGTRVLKA